MESVSEKIVVVCEKWIKGDGFREGMVIGAEIGVY